MRHLVLLLTLSSVCFLALSEVVIDFSQCRKFFLNNIPPILTPPAGVSINSICQCLWDDQDQKVYVYATLYSTTWKIPIYSAYRFASPNIGRCDAWYIEPQVIIVYMHIMVKGEVCQFWTLKYLKYYMFRDNGKSVIG